MVERLEVGTGGATTLVGEAGSGKSTLLGTIGSRAGRAGVRVVRLSGVESLSMREVLPDGTIVEARWDMNQPTVRIYPPGSLDAACELYVESGLLDLGPNIASDAGQRFNPGLPEFDDSRATLYFGTGVDCTDGLNGTVNMDGSVLRSQCLADGGEAVPSRLAIPAKKQAQAALPASCWSGRMRPCATRWR